MQAVELIKDGMTAVGKALGVGHDAKEPQNAITILTSQHREVDTLFSEIEGAGDKAYKKKEGTLGILIDKLLLHTDLEETLFYPAAKAVDAKLVLESFEEHAAMKMLLKKLLGADAKDESFDAKVTVLKELVHHHVREEETDLFPKCKDKMSDDLLEEIGDKMQARIDTKAAREKIAVVRDQGGPRKKTALKAAAHKSKAGTKARAKPTATKKAKSRATVKSPQKTKGTRH